MVRIAIQNFINYIFKWKEIDDQAQSECSNNFLFQQLSIHHQKTPILVLIWLVPSQQSKTVH